MSVSNDAASLMAACRARQSRLVEYMNEMGIDWSLVVTPENVHYLVGSRFAWTFQPAAAVSASGHVILIAPEGRIPDVHAADDVHAFSARFHSTLRNDQRQVASETLAGVLGTEYGTDLNGSSSHRLGVEFSTISGHFPWRGERVDIEPYLYQMRRHKDAEERRCIQWAIDATERMYERARQIIAPGVNELDVFNELQSVAVRYLGEPLTGTGNDYQCGSRGGPPRNRQIESGELYILDLGPAFRGYFADNARTIAVTEPSTAQTEAWKCVTDVFQIVEDRVKPGVSARGLFDEVQAFLDRCPHGVFNHHLGHGIGLFPHEAPHLNPFWDDTFQIGDVFTAEPGVYSAELKAGMRIENDYVVTETGVERLTNFPLELML